MAEAKKAKTTKPTAKKKDTKKKVTRLSSPKVKVVVNSTYNNTLIAISDYNGNVIATSSSGAVGFTGSRKSTAYAGTKAGEDVARKAMKVGAQEAVVIVRGIGEGRQSAVKGLRSAGLKITSLSDHTPVPHGGTKPRRSPKK